MPGHNLPRHEGELQEAGHWLGCATCRLVSLPCVELLPELKNGYGRRHACAIVLAMRYVIVIAAIAFFLIWDGLYNQGRYLDMSVRELSHVVRYVTGKA